MEISITDLMDFLGTVPGFRDLPEADIRQKIIPIIGITRYEPGQTIIHRGDAPHTLFIIYQGQVHGRTIHSEQREHHSFIHEGQVFGELALVSNQRRSSTIVAASPTICLTLDIDTLQQIMMRDWRFSKAFFILIGQRTIERLVKAEVKHYHWSEKYRIGIPEVDDQHKRLFEAINELGQFLSDPQKVENQRWYIQNFLIEISNYVERHFRDEEKMMAEAQAPWLDEHRQIHQGLAADFQDFRTKITNHSHNDEQLHTLEQIHKFMGNWLTQHILKEDARFGLYFQQSQRSDH